MWLYVPLFFSRVPLHMLKYLLSVLLLNTPHMLVVYSIAISSVASMA